YRLTVFYHNGFEVNQLTNAFGDDPYDRVVDAATRQMLLVEDYHKVLEYPNGVDEERFIEVYSRKKKGKNRGKSTRIDGVIWRKRVLMTRKVRMKRHLNRVFFEVSTVPNDTYDSPKVTKAGGARVSKTTKVPSTPFSKSARPECINESDTDEDDIVSSYGPSLGGGDQLEDGDFDFFDGYEAQVFDLPGQLKKFRDFRLSMSGRK
nr:hypothetical protein [Tanacetum cinerariifolium]